MTQRYIVVVTYASADNVGTIRTYVIEAPHASLAQAYAAYKYYVHWGAGRDDKPYRTTEKLTFHVTPFTEESVYKPDFSQAGDLNYHDRVETDTI